MSKLKKRKRKDNDLKMIDKKIISLKNLKSINIIYFFFTHFYLSIMPNINFFHVYFLFMKSTEINFKKGFERFFSIPNLDFF